MKSMKKKLLAAAAMLTVSAVMLTSSTFAWFTVSTAPEIADIDVTMTATKNLEIAKASTGLADANKPTEVAVGNAGDETKWGSKVTTFTTSVDFPALRAGNDIKTISYDANGRVNADSGYVTAAMGDFTDGVAYYTADIKQGDTTLKSGAKVAAVFGVWLRSNVACTGDNAVVAAVTDADTGADNSKWDIVVANASGIPYADNKIPMATADTATPVTVIIFAKGESVTAADIDAGLTVDNLKITFSSGAVDTFANQHPAST